MKVPRTTNATLRSQLAAVERSLGPTGSLTSKTRKQLGNRAATAPDALVALMLEIAAQNGGRVAGMPLDVDATNATLADVKDALAAAATARAIAQRLMDDAVAKRVVVSDRIIAIYVALRRIVRTPEGNALLGPYQEMSAIAKKARRPSRKRKATP